MLKAEGIGPSIRSAISRAITPKRGPIGRRSISRESALRLANSISAPTRWPMASLRPHCRPQARIAILSKNVPAFFELWFGAAKADMVLVPVNFRLAPAEVAYVVADAGAELLFVGADFYPVVDKVAQELKSVRQIIALDEPHGSWTNYADWIASQSTTDPGFKHRAGPLRHSDVYQRYDRAPEGRAA